MNSIPACQLDGAIMRVFKNRFHAGQVLTQLLQERLSARWPQNEASWPPAAKVKPDIILALPRGGVPVASPISEALDAPLDVWVARKIGVPGHRELAMGAIAEGGGRFVHGGILTALQMDASHFAQAEEQERIELERRVQTYRAQRPQPRLENRFVLLIDDGVATGSTLMAAISGVLAQVPARLWVGIPVASRQSLELLSATIDDVLCAHVPTEFFSVGGFYEDFRQVTDQEVVEILKAAKKKKVGSNPRFPTPPDTASPDS